MNNDRTKNVHGHHIFFINSVELKAYEAGGLFGHMIFPPSVATVKYIFMYAYSINVCNLIPSQKQAAHFKRTRNESRKSTQWSGAL